MNEQLELDTNISAIAYNRLGYLTRIPGPAEIERQIDEYLDNLEMSTRNIEMSTGREPLIKQVDPFRRLEAHMTIK